MQIPQNVAEYISRFPDRSQLMMQQIRALVIELVPDAEESIAYGMPTFKKNGLLTHFGAYQYHIGLYPGPEALMAHKDEISKYKNAKGSVQFPLDQPMPMALIKSIIEFRIGLNEKNREVVKDKSARKPSQNLNNINSWGVLKKQNPV